MKRILIVSNPLAADGQSAALLEGSSVFDSNFERVLIDARSSHELASVLKTADPSNTAAIVIFGGDGTFSRCLNQLAGAKIPIAVFPAGTVNDFASGLGMTTNWRDLLAIILENTSVPIPVLEANGRPLVVYGSLGLGAETSRHLQRTRAGIKAFRRTLPTLQSPLFAILTIFFSNRYRMRLRLSLDGVERELRTPGIYVANQSRVNRRIDLEWDRSANPRKFRLVVFKPIGKLQLLWAVMRLSSTRQLSSVRALVDVFDVERATIESLDSPICFATDGEPAGECQRMTVTVASEPLRMFRGPNHR